MFDQLTCRSVLAVFFTVAAVAACDVETVKESTAATPSVIAGVSPSIHAIFPAASCRPGFLQAGPRLCANSAVQNPATYVNAVSICRNNRSHVCSYEDLSYLYLNSSLDGNYNPNGRWIGNMPSDDQVFCGNAAITANNDPDITNFEGTCAKNQARGFWCCHDDIE
jgi:hypothetical protein